MHYMYILLNRFGFNVFSSYGERWGNLDPLGLGLDLFSGWGGTAEYILRGYLSPAGPLYYFLFFYETGTGMCCYNYINRFGLTVFCGMERGGILFVYYFNPIFFVTGGGTAEYICKGGFVPSGPLCTIFLYIYETGLRRPEQILKGGGHWCGLVPSTCPPLRGYVN